MAEPAANTDGPDADLHASTVTLLLETAREQGRDALPDLFHHAYDHLYRIARGVRARWTHDATTGATALVHEAYLKLAASGGSAWEGKSHFLAVAAKAMRQILTDHARRRCAAKRGGGGYHEALTDSRVAAADGGGRTGGAPEELLALDAVLERLGRRAPRVGQVVECRFYAGLSVVETAEALSISTTTVKRDWAYAQAWLYRELQDRAS